jgi:putative addiction module CopG family antidote
MEIDLEPEVERYISAKISSGVYPSASAAVNDLLVDRKRQEEWTAEDVAELRALVAVGIKQLDGGEGVAWDAEQMKRRLREHIARAKGS